MGKNQPEIIAVLNKEDALFKGLNFTSMSFDGKLGMVFRKGQEYLKETFLNIIP